MNLLVLYVFCALHLLNIAAVLLRLDILDNFWSAGFESLGLPAYEWKDSHRATSHFTDSTYQLGQSSHKP